MGRRPGGKDVHCTAHEDGYDAVVIGAGFAGLNMVHRLREQGMRVLGIEKGAGVGGTWYRNRYPGARCNSEVMYYSYSFLPDVEQDWPLEERYPGQLEILHYLEHVADKLDLRKDFVLGATVEHLHFDEGTGHWTVELGNAAPLTAKWVVTAVGCLSTANVPSIPGADTFEGRVLHSQMARSGSSRARMASAYASASARSASKLARRWMAA